MANKRIQDLDPATLPLDGSELIELEQSGGSAQATTQDIANLVTAPTAADVSYDNSATGLSATNVQDAIDEHIGNTNANIDYLVFEWGSNGSNASPTIGGSGTPMATSTQGASAVAGTIAYNSSLLNAIMRIEVVSPSSANNTCSVHQVNTFAGHVRRTSGNARGGGFDLTIWFGLPDVKSDQRLRIGSYGNNSTAPPSGTDPSANTGRAMFGFAKDTADTNLQFMTNSSVGTANKIDTGLVFTSLADKLLRARFVALPGGTSISYELYDEETGTLLTSGSSSTNLPAADLPMWWVAWADTGPTTTPISVTWSRTRLRCKYGINF